MVLIKAKLISMGKGGTQKNISQAVLKSLDVIVPPLSEQKRIVSRIEELFSQLDASVAKLKTAKERLKVYRQAVLKEAFSKFDGSIEKTISSVCENIVDCPHSTPKWVQKGKLCLRTTNFKPGYLNLSEKNYVSEETFCERISRLAPKPGDVLFSREGAILGIACIIPDGLEVCMGQRMMLLRPSEDLLNKYLMYYLNSPKARTLIIENVGGTASPHINVGDIKNFTIPIIPFAQQQSVVAEIESRLSVCDNIEKTVGTALQQAEALRQSILKIAFEGGL
jgi:type I restriction enzyme S subunit